MKRNFLFLFIFLTTISSFAQSDQKRLDEMENKLKTLSEKVEKLEKTLTKSNGFMIVANVNCTIKTPFDGEFTATELSESAARSSVTEKCQQKVPDKTQCLPQFVVCKK
ncbi:hypothetical protein K2X05_00275 [bacterium]|nr:hypothetical protein [bacterium]